MLDKNFFEISSIIEDSLYFIFVLQLLSIKHPGRKVLVQQKLKNALMSMLGYLLKKVPLDQQDIIGLNPANTDETWIANAIERLCVAVPQMLSPSQVVFLCALVAKSLYLYC